MKRIQNQIVLLWGRYLAIAFSFAIVAASFYWWCWLVKGSTNADVVHNIALMVGGVWAIYAVLLAAERVKIALQQQVSESLAHVGKQLSSEIISIRVLAILTLSKIAIEGDKEICQNVIEVLCLYLQDKCSIHKNDILFSKDMQRILDTLHKIQHKKPEHSRLDLSETDLSVFDLRCANLSSADLNKSILQGDLEEIDLSGAILHNADLRGNTNLLSAKLHNADLRGAKLHQAKLLRSDLSHAKLWGADLPGANLCGADLSHADLLNANLSGAKMKDVKGLDTTKNLETVEDPKPPQIDAEIKRRKQAGQE